MIGPGKMITATTKGLGKIKEFNIRKENQTWIDIKNSNFHKSSNILRGILIFVFVVLFVTPIGTYFLIKNKNTKKNSRKKHK